MIKLRIWTIIPLLLSLFKYIKRQNTLHLTRNQMTYYTIMLMNMFGKAYKKK